MKHHIRYITFDNDVPIYYWRGTALAGQSGSIVSNISGTVNLSDLVYFSYITLTTLGYGEIIPVSAKARSLAIIEAIAGVMYIAIIISRLVRIFIVKTLNERDK